MQQYDYATRRALARQREERQEREAEGREAAEEQARQNAAARTSYLAGLARDKADQARRAEAETDAALAPARARAEREWLLAHPGKDAADFARVAWPLVRQNLVEDREAGAVEATRASLLATGRYGL